jgi:small subunit ribosomal protein S4
LKNFIGSTADRAEDRLRPPASRKLKVRRVYGVLERQFRTTRKAALQKGITGENLMVNLERRLDASFTGCISAPAAPVHRWYGHIDVNGRKCDIPSAQVKIGDIISVRETSKTNHHPVGCDATAHAPAPNWIVWT